MIFLMKKVISILAAILICGITSAQFASVQRGQQEQPLPEGFKPSSCNTFLSQYPAVNAQTGQAMFRVVAPTARKVQVDLAGMRYDMTKYDKGVWTCISNPQVAGFHYANGSRRANYEIDGSCQLADSLLRL